MDIDIKRSCKNEDQKESCEEGVWNVHSLLLEMADEAALRLRDLARSCLQMLNHGEAATDLLRPA